MESNALDQSAAKQRRLSIDALRGLAVVLMITQHVTYWLVRGVSYNRWLVLSTGALGGLAAPIFVVLAGLGVAFLSRRHERGDHQLVIRGAMIFAFGYLMNLLTPHWFSLGSWYVLHLIGFTLMIAPLVRRLPNHWVLALLAVVVLATMILQTRLGTPFRLFNHDMAVPRKPGGIFRFALVEGFFPIFPWLSFFLAGLLAGRWLLAGKPNKIWQLAGVLIAIMAALTSVYALAPDFAHHTQWIRLFKLTSTFYPSLTPLTLFLIAVALLFVYLFVSLEKRYAFKSFSGLVCLGRASLTLLIVHVAAIREGAFFFGFWKSFSAPVTLVLVALLLWSCTFASVKWRKINFKYGAEWLLRKAA